MKSIVVAYDNERAIGRHNELLWNIGEMKNDMRRFRSLTMGNAVIMGRNTFESIGSPLPRRRNLVLSRSVIEIAGVEVVTSLEEAFARTGDADAYVIGGAEVYAQAVPMIDRIYATEVDTVIDDADAYFTDIRQAEWRAVVESTHLADAENIYTHRFVTYDRI